MAKPIDPSHHTFKRAGGIGPGPKRRPRLHQAQDWECQKGKNTSKSYVQICTYVGDNKARRGKKLKVVTSKVKKKRYNKLWRKWAKNNARIRRCTRRAPSVATSAGPPASRSVGANMKKLNEIGDLSRS
jgi:hypothetical protein